MVYHRRGFHTVSFPCPARELTAGEPLTPCTARELAATWLLATFEEGTLAAGELLARPPSMAKWPVRGSISSLLRPGAAPAQHPSANPMVKRAGWQAGHEGAPRRAPWKAASACGPKSAARGANVLSVA